MRLCVSILERLAITLIVPPRLHSHCIVFETGSLTGGEGGDCAHDPPRDLHVSAFPVLELQELKAHTTTHDFFT